MYRRLAATLSVLLVINLRAVRRHPLRALLAALSLGGGVAVVVAVMIETTSVSTAIDDVGYRIAGPAPLRFVGAATRGGIAPSAIESARRVPGVAATVPVIRAVTVIRDGDQERFVLGLGIDCSAQWILDPAVCRPGQKEPPAPATSTTLGKSLSPSATLATNVGELPLQMVQKVDDLNSINNGFVVVLPLSVAQAQFARGDRVDMVYVTVTEGAVPSQVRERLIDALGPGFSVMTRSDPARGFNVNGILFPMLAIFALVAVGVGIILIAQITRLSVEERRRETAIAAALGASPLSAVVGFLAEAAVLGAVGSVIGVLMGVVIARPVVKSASELTQLYVGINVSVLVEPRVLLVGLVMGVLLAILAASIPSLSASKTAIATELSGRATYEGARAQRIWPKALALLIVGLIAVLAARSATSSGGLEQWQAGVTNAAVVVAIAGLLSAAAYLSAQLIAAVRMRPERARGPTLTIALTALRADGARTTAIAGAVAVPVAVATLLSGFLVAINRGASDVAESQADGRLVVTTTRFTDWGAMDAKFSAATIAQLAALPGVRNVDRMAEREINFPDGSLAYVRAEDRPAFPFAVLSGRSPQESVDADELVIGAILARERRVRVGDTLSLGSGSRARDMVVGTVLATPELGGRRIQLSYRLADQIFGPEPAGLVLVTPAPGYSLGQISAEIKSATFNQSVQVTDSSGYREVTAQGVARFLTPLNALRYGLLAIAFVSVSSTLLLVGMRRRREVALIQALGATRFKVFAITTVEAIVASAAGALFGALLSIAIMDALGRAAIVDVGSVTPLSFPLSQALTYAGLATAAAVIAAILPAWKNIQAAPATELRDE